MYHFALLCGMFTQHLDDDRKSDAASRYGVGVMLRANEIREALMTDGNQKERRKWDEDAAKAESGPQLENVSQGDETQSEDEFERFENLTRKLVKGTTYLA